MDLRFNRRQAFGQLGRHLGQEGRIEADAGHFHVGQHGHQRHFHFFQQAQSLAGFQLGAQAGDQLQDRRRIRRRIGARLLGGHFGHAALVLAGSDQLLDFGHSQVQAHPGQVLQPQVVRGRVGQPFGQHGVECQGRGAQPEARQDDEIVLDVVAGLGNAGVGQWAAQRLQHAFLRQLRSQAGIMTHRDVIPLAAFHGQRNANQAGAHRVGGGGLGVEGDQAGLL